MNKIRLLVIAATLVISCKQKEKKEDIYKGYPKSLAKVLEKHGGLKGWRKAKVLSFKKGEEVHTTNLHSRKTLIQAPNYTIGFDGRKTWLQQNDSTAFKGNKEFYYNLYFYFYAMPFVLADDGIIYEETTPVVFEGITYPGFKVSYNSEVGVSPDDNYFVYYNSKTFQMEWLGYTVTYFSKKPSMKSNIIRYNDWIDVNGFLLPKSITWYKKNEDGQPLEAAKGPVNFKEGLLSQVPLAENFYNNPN
ncbi:hypothetical protein OAT18_01800 [Tenacibaculum sp.]|nr:hypothetical protein [Tenacibaculum sp.]